MSRKAYLYTLLPVVMLLNSGASLSGLVGATAAMLLGAVLGFVCWMLIWRRLYAARTLTRLRPEFSLLAILPQEAFYVLNMAGAEAAAPFAEGIWPGINLLLWGASVWIILASLNPGWDGKAHGSWRDPVSLISGAFIILSSFMGWTSCTMHLFPFLVK